MKVAVKSFLNDSVIGFEHFLAIFASTILVPLIAGLHISASLFSAGVATLIFIFFTKKQVPISLSSCFSVLPGLIVVMTMRGYSNQASTLAVMIANVGVGLVFIIFSILVSAMGKRTCEGKQNRCISVLHKIFPAIVVAPIVIVIGMTLSFNNIWQNIMNNYIGLGGSAWKEWTTALITLITVVAVRLLTKEYTRVREFKFIIALLVGVAYSLCIGLIKVDFSGNIVVFQQLEKEFAFLTAWNELDGALIATSILSVIPLCALLFQESFGDVMSGASKVAKVNEKDSNQPILRRALLGQGVASIVCGIIGGPILVTYGETGNIASATGNTRVRPIVICSAFMMLISLFVPISELLSAIPSAVIGGIGIYAFGWLTANGVKALGITYKDVNGRTRRYLENSKNMIILSIVLALGLGLGAFDLVGSVIHTVSAGQFSKDAFVIGFYLANGRFIKISGIVIALIVGLILNLVLPESRDEKRDPNEEELVLIMDIQDESPDDVEGFINADAVHVREFVDDMDADAKERD